MTDEGEKVEKGGATPRLLLVVPGVVLFVIAVALITMTEGGPGEFGYSPFNMAPLPFAPMRGFTFEQLVAHVAGIVLATPALILIWLGVREAAAFADPREDLARHLAIGASAGSVGLIAFVMLVVLRGRPIVDDELVYRMQAALLAEGRLASDDVPGMTHEVFTVVTKLGVTGKYLFGEPLVQVPGVLVGVPALMHIPIAALTLWCLYRAAALLADRQIARWLVVLVACSPMFILTSATAQSQATSLSCVAAAALGYAFARADRPWLAATLVGVGVAFGVPVRPQVAVPVGTVLVLMTAWRLFKVRRFGAIALLGVILAAGAALVCAYNYALTGNPLKLPWFLLEPTERYGFVQVWDTESYRHTPWKLVENLIVTVVRFNSWWMGWPSSLLLLWLWHRTGRPTKGAALWLWIGFAVVLFEAGYYSTGISDTGPIYHYELLLPAAALGANAIVRGFGQNVRSFGVLLMVQFGLGWTTFMWFQTSRLDRLVSHVHDDVEAALAKVTTPAILFYEKWCTESTARAWVHQKLPMRNRASWDDVITYPRPPAPVIPTYLKIYEGRDCWYFRIHPRTFEPQVLRCRDALPLLNRPVKLDSNRCLWNASTAARLGLYDPWKALSSRGRGGFGVDVRTGGSLGTAAGASQSGER